MLKRKLLVVPLLALIAAAGIPAASNAGVEKNVRTTGTFVGVTTGPSLLVTFTCAAVGVPNAVYTEIKCWVVGGTKVLKRGLPGPASAVAGTDRTTVSPVKVCWEAFALYPNTERKDKNRCITKTIGGGNSGAGKLVPSAGVGAA